ncbi:MAG: ABC transporter ATP-binding protein [Promethearchaeota archaeon]
MSLFLAKDICKRFGGLEALTNVDVEIKQDEILGLIGPNGAGKSVFINCITGEYKPNSGSVTFNNEDITGKPAHVVFRKGIARTYQHSRIFYNLPVLEGMRIAHLPTLENEKHKKDDASAHDVSIKKLLNEVGLWPKKDIIANQLSLFEQKKLEIAMKALSKPRLLMLDEPIGGLTSEEISNILNLIEKLNRDYKISIMIIEHTMKVIYRLAKRVVVLNQGRKIADGSPEEVLNDEKVIESYMGSGQYTKRFLSE